ncbi:MAG: hypothetical protein ACQXXH_04970 [Candidatus Bathyarchaeia archaeon]|jgi:uncharacterized membrane protein (DUF2068 family)|nr:hypothetical protein [Candidatus Bathyarchaeota archaeon A05DMB-4]MDH7595086.1 hypothetical protein [Candidatus Bathyarchaeota archaeon]
MRVDAVYKKNKFITLLPIAIRQIREALTMDLKSKLKIESLPIFTFLVFYVLAGVANLYILIVNGAAMAHTAIIAVLSLITAFGLYKMEKWSLWLVVVLFFIGNTFGITTLYTSITKYGFAGTTDVLLLNLAFVGYLIMTWLATIYIAAKKDQLK